MHTHLHGDMLNKEFNFVLEQWIVGVSWDIKDFKA